MLERRLLALLLWCCSCSQTHELATSAEPDASQLALADAAPLRDAQVALCGSSACACSNGLDDDGDGLIDGFDPECTSPSDQFEDSFATGVHGEDQSQKCQDCFFDDNSGAGDDGCSRARSCALDGTSSGGSGACNDCAVAAKCSDSCRPLAPNGCDCFGCCSVFHGGVETHILLSASCSLAVLDDPTRCTVCLPAADCLNPCGRCELCAGRLVTDLPADCQAANGPGYTCDESKVCSSGADCSGSEYCQQGCCLQVGI
jgi:hypothetical protein